MELSPNRQFGFIDNKDRQSGSGSVPTRTRARSDGPDPLLTLSIQTMVTRPMITFDVDKPRDSFCQEVKWTLAIS
jgi:hypothetical protein